jgi:hypothetical protein
VFILEHYFSSKSFVTVREAFCSVCAHKDVPNKTVQKPVTKFRKEARITLGRLNACLRKVMDIFSVCWKVVL